MAYLLFDSGKCLLDDSPSMHDENKLRQITGSSFLSCRVQVKIWWSGTLTMRQAYHRTNLEDSRNSTFPPQSRP